MNAQLQQVMDELESASERLERLQRAVPAEHWSRRLDPDRWSVSECVAHLNLTTEAYLPALRKGLDEARGSKARVPARFRRGLLGWLLWRTMGPPARMKVRTPARFIPQATAEPSALIAEFQRLQGELIELVRRAEGLPLQAVKIRSPFAERASYNLFAAFTLLPPHQHRHLWQAEQLIERG